MKGMDGKQFTTDVGMKPTFATWLQTFGFDFLYVQIQADVP